MTTMTGQPPTSTEGMKITLYDSPTSIHTQYVRVVLDELGIPYTKKELRPPFDTTTPSFAEISKAMSLPAMTIDHGDTTTTTLTDSKEIILYCCQSLTSLSTSAEGDAGVGPDVLFPKDKLQQITHILDHIYSAAAAQLSIQVQVNRSSLFALALEMINSQRKKIVMKNANDPNIPSHIQQLFKDQIQRGKTPINASSAGTTAILKKYPSIDTLVNRVNHVISYLDRILQEQETKAISNNSNSIHSNNDCYWLLGGDHYTVIDGIVAVWIQWVVWTDHPKVILSDRVTQLLENVKKHSKVYVNVTNPIWIIDFIMIRLKIATTILFIFFLFLGFAIAAFYRFYLEV